MRYKKSLKTVRETVFALLRCDSHQVAFFLNRYCDAEGEIPHPILTIGVGVRV